MSPYPQDLMLPGGALEPGGLLDQMLGVEAPQLDTTTETLPRLRLLQRILQGYAGFEPGIQPRGFGEGVVAGIGRGLGRAGERSMAERAAMERGITERQRARDQANLAASRSYRERRGLRLREYNREQARLAEKESDYRRKNPPPGSPEYSAMLKRREDEARATEAGRQKARPRRPPQAPRAEPLVAVDTPQGPVYVRRSEAVGMKPAGKAGASKGGAQAAPQETITQQTIRAARIAGVANGKDLGRWLGAKLSTGKTRVQVLVDRGVDLRALGASFQ